MVLLGLIILLLIILTLLGGVSWYIGSQAGSIWAGVGCLAGIILVIYGAYFFEKSLTARKVERQFLGWFLIALGITLLIIIPEKYMWAGRWVWTIICLFLMYRFLLLGSFASHYIQTLSSEIDKKRTELAYKNLYFIAYFMGLWYIVAPFFFYKISFMLQDMPQELSFKERILLFSSYLSMALEFLKWLIHHGWAMLYVMIFIFLCSLLFRCCGIIIAILPISFLFAYLKIFHPQLDEVLRQLLISNPVEAIKQFILFGNNVGVPPWGSLILLAILIKWFLLPALIRTKDYREKIKALPLFKRMYGTTFARKFMMEAGIEAGPLIGLTNLFLTLVGFVTPILLWIALRKMVNVEGVSFSFFIIPDLRVPHFKPVWQVSYFIFPFILGLLGVRQYFSLQAPQLSELLSAFRSVVGILGILFCLLIFGLFVPAGVTMFLVFQSLTFMIVEKATIPKEIEISKPEREKKPEPKSEKKPEPSPERTKPEPRKPQVPELAGEVLYSHDRPCVDFYALDKNNIFLLDETNTLYLIKQGQVFSKVDLPENEWFIGMELGENKLVCVGNSGKFITVVPGSRGTIYSVSIGFGGFSGGPDLIARTDDINCYAINPFGTILALGGGTSPVVYALFLATRQLIPLYEESSKTAVIKAIGFSKDGRYIGFVAGEILNVFDIATRRIVDSFDLTQVMPFPSALIHTPKGWLIKNGYLIGYSADKKTPKIWSESDVTYVLCVDKRILYGNSKGQVKSVDPIDVFFSDVTCRQLVAPVHKGGIIRIRHLHSEGDTDTFVSLGADNKIKLFKI